MSKVGTLYMIPCPIVEHKNDSIPSETISLTHGISHFVVERARTARRWLSSIQHPTKIDDMEILELDKYETQQDLSQMLSFLKAGHDVGVLSEAGCPGIADPGHKAVKLAHAQGIKVAPLVGPNSILMALMASGFNGQSFAFHGYLPSKKPELSKKLKQLISILSSTGQTQLFMEAPYRNGFMLEQLVSVCSDQAFLTVACDINAPTEDILTQPISKWKNVDAKKYHKRPAIFVLGK